MSQAHAHCPHCGFAYTVAPEQAAAMAGRAFACTNCGQPFTLSPSGAAFVPPVTPQPTVAYASAADAKANPLAIASLICGCLLCVPFLPGIASIVTGALGMRKARDPGVTGKGMAIAGLVLGILNLLGWGAYFALIFAIMVPSMGMARQTANQVKCASNLRQIGLAVLLYSNENRGAFPDSVEQLLLTQDITADVFVCPSTSHTKATGQSPQEIADDLAGGAGHLSYVYVGQGMNEREVDPKTVVAYEPLSNHGTGSNFLFADGSVQFLLAAQAERMIGQLEGGQNPPMAGPSADRLPTTETPPPVEVER